MKTTILLTGGAGYIGSHTAVELISLGYNVMIADNFCNSNKNVIERIEKITDTKIKYYDINICNKAEFYHVFRENHIDCVIHFAGYKAPGESVKKPMMYYRNNLDSTMALCELMSEYRVKKLVFSSSASVYGMSQNVPIKETEPVGCVSPYARTKQMIEKMLTDVAEADTSMSVIMLRYFNPVGAHQSGLIGEVPNGIPNNLMPYITQVAVGKREKLSVYGNDYPTKDGTGIRDYIHIVDLARAHVAAVNYCLCNTGAEIINIGTGVGYSVLDIIKTFETVNGVMIPYRIVGRRAGDIATSYADVSKAKALLHWQAKLGIADMCLDSWRWQKNNPTGYES